MMHERSSINRLNFTPWNHRKKIKSNPNIPHTVNIPHIIIIKQVRQITLHTQTKLGKKNATCLKIHQCHLFPQPHLPQILEALKNA